MSAATKAELTKLAEELEKWAHEGAQSMTQSVVAMAMQDARDAAAVRRTIELLSKAEA